MGAFWRNQITWDNRPKCPPIEDCGAKNARPARPTARQKREAARLVKAQKAARAQAKAERKAAKNQPRDQSWPNKGSYTPPRARGRG